VNRPGAYEVSNGITLRELIEEYAGGIKNGNRFKAIAPSGPSGGFLPAKLPVTALRSGFVEKLPAGATHYDLLDWPLDIALSRSMGLMLGAGMVVYDDTADMVDQAWACSRFYRDESCGKCVPCRIGSHKLTEILANIHQREFDVAALTSTTQLAEELGQVMAITSICGLGQVASAPIRSLLKFFVDDVEKHIKN
jgi:NADH:ubiquinone oxidoreductase subunit F (NADH-binding)